MPSVFRMFEGKDYDLCDSKAKERIMPLIGQDFDPDAPESLDLLVNTIVCPLYMAGIMKVMTREQKRKEFYNLLGKLDDIVINCDYILQKQIAVLIRQPAQPS
jgi:hypothetical protein